MWDVGAGDMGYKGAATSNGLVSVGLRVALHTVIGGVQEESIGSVDARVVQVGKSSVESLAMVCRVPR